MEKSFVGDSYKYDVNYHRFADFFGVDVSDRNEAKLAQKLSMLYDWGVYKSGSGEFARVTKEISKLQRQLGVTYIGVPLVNTLTHWARIDIDNKRLRTKQKIEDEKLRMARESLKERHVRAESLKEERAKEERLLSKEKVKVGKETTRYIDKYNRDIPREQRLKVREIPMQESESVPIKI